MKWLVAAVLVLALAGRAEALAATRQEQWRQEVRAASTAPLERNTRAELRRALAALDALALGASRPAVHSLQQQSSRAFFDASRVHEARLLEDTQRLVEQTREAWLSGRAAQPRALEAAGALLRVQRQAAEVALADARLLGTQRPRWLKPSAWDASRSSLQQAEEAWPQALSLLKQGEALEAGHLLLATWRHATSSLSAVGVLFRPGLLTDVDSDGVPDQLEVRLGASPLSSDTDGDGLSDAFEARWGGAHLLPSLRDSDGDGVPDGDEDTDGDGLSSLQEQSLRSDPLRPPRPPTSTSHPPRSARAAPPTSRGTGPLLTLRASLRTFSAHSPPEAPWGVDSDGDGLEDEAERFYGTHPFLADSDSDGLNDSLELAHATEPDVADTDGDGFSDGEEVAHLSDGFDPLVPDERLTPGEWARDYSDGLLLGDSCDTLFSGWKPCKGNVPFFLGQLSGGAASFIPVAGWVVGTLGDVRDTLGSAVKGDWVGAGLSVVGLLPYVGDVGTLAGKVVAFTARYGKLEAVLRAVLLRLPRVLAARPATRWLPSSDAASLGPTARALVLEVLRKLDPKGFSHLHRYGGEEFLTRLASWGSRWEDLSLLFSRLEHSGLFSQYPRMQDFLVEMIRSTPDEVLFGGGHLLSLQGRVTLNLKKAALRLQHGPPKYLETVRNHLRAALAEHSTLSHFVSHEELIPLGHITANGVDRVFRHGNVIHVLEVKASSKLGLHDLKNWLRKSVDPGTGQTVFLFNGNRLREYLNRAGHSRLDTLLTGRQLHFNLFVYDANPRLTEELLELLKTGKKKISAEGMNNVEITLTLTRHWN
jgi:hypothetical protein